jgi:hypothetical protein
MLTILSISVISLCICIQIGTKFRPKNEDRFAKCVIVTIMLPNKQLPPCA